MSDEPNSGTESAPPPRKRRRKHKGGHGHHGGAWKVAYADFITTMMALFLLLWLLSTQDQTSRVMMSLYFRDPGVYLQALGRNMVPGSGMVMKTRLVPILELAGSGGKGQSRESDQTVYLERIALKLRQRLEPRATVGRNPLPPQIKLIEGGVEIVLADSDRADQFEPDSAVMTFQAEAYVREIGAIIAPIKDFRISIAGYTDGRPPTNPSYTHQDLSADRAQRMMQTLVMMGVDPERFNDLVGYGDTLPIDPTQPLAAVNRRIVLSLKAMTLQELSGIQKAAAAPGSMLHVEDDASESPDGTPEVGKSPPPDEANRIGPIQEKHEGTHP